MSQTIYGDEEIIAVALRHDGCIACVTKNNNGVVKIWNQEVTTTVPVPFSNPGTLRWTSTDHLIVGSDREACIIDQEENIIEFPIPSSIGKIQKIIVDDANDDFITLIGSEGSCILEKYKPIWSCKESYIDANIIGRKEKIYAGRIDNTLCRSGFRDITDHITNEDFYGNISAIEFTYQLFVAYHDDDMRAHQIICFDASLDPHRQFQIEEISMPWSESPEVFLNLFVEKNNLYHLTSRGCHLVKLDTDEVYTPIEVWGEETCDGHIIGNGECIILGKKRKGIHRRSIGQTDRSESKQSTMTASTCDEPEEVKPIVGITIQTGPINPNSTLGRAMGLNMPKPKPKPKPKSYLPQKGTMHKLQDLPTTFHRKVHSSGYLPKAKPKTIPKRGATKSASSTAPKKERIYCSEPPLHAEASIPFTSAITDVKYTHGGEYLLAATSADHTLYALKCPATKSKATPCVHKAPITSIATSRTESHSSGGGGGPLCLTTADSKAHLFSIQGPHAGQELITFDRIKSSRRDDDDSQNGTMQVTGATFLCLDSVIVLSMPSQLGIYRYQLHTQDKKDDITRIQKFGSYVCAGLLQHDGLPMHGVTANNNSCSSLCLTHSQREIMAWDLASEKRLAQIHTDYRITSLQLSTPNVGSPRSCDLFYTASIDGCVRLWDLRTMKVELEFIGHQHNTHRLTPKWSPCMNYMAIPSENGFVSIYDSRNASNLFGSTRGHKDVCSSVDFNPISGTLVSGGFDSICQFYRAKDVKTKVQPKKGGGREVVVPLEKIISHDNLQYNEYDKDFDIM